MYDDAGQAVETVDASGLRTGTVYYADGQVEYAGPLSSSAPADWYTLADPTQFFLLDATSGRRQFTTHAYNQLDATIGQPTSGLIYDAITDPLGNVTTTYKDGAGRTIRRVCPDGSFSETLYSNNPGQVGVVPSIDQEGDALTVPVGLSIQPGQSVTVQIAQRKAGEASQATFSLTDSGGNLIDEWQPGVSDYAATVLNDSPVLYWRLGESGGTIAADSSGNGDSGTYSAIGVTLAQSGPLAGDSDTAISINGGSVASSQTLNLARVTVSAWVKLQGVPTSDQFLAGFANGVGSGTYDKDLYVDSSGRINWYVFDGSQRFVTGPALELNKWYHVGQGRRDHEQAVCERPACRQHCRRAGSEEVHQPDSHGGTGRRTAASTP